MNAEKLPRTTAAPHLQSLWRKHDLTDAVVGFLDLNAICSLPALSKSFFSSQLRVLCAAGTQAVIKRAIVGGLRDAGRDVVRFRERWDSLGRWVTNFKGVQDFALQRAPGGNHVALSKLSGRTGFHDCEVHLDFDGERNCIKSFRVQCRYSGQHQFGGGDFALMSTDSSQKVSTVSHLCRFFFRPNGGADLSLPPNASQEIKLLTWINYLGPGLGDSPGSPQVTTLCDARPDQWYTVEAEFDWDTSTAIVSVDGVRVTQPLTFNKLPLRGLHLGNYSHFTSHFGAIDVEYYAGSRQRFDSASEEPGGGADY